MAGWCGFAGGLPAALSCSAVPSAGLARRPGMLEPKPPGDLLDRGTTGFVDVPLSSGDRPRRLAFGVCATSPARDSGVCQPLPGCGDRFRRCISAFRRRPRYIVHPARYYLATQTPVKQARSGDVIKLPVGPFYDGFATVRTRGSGADRAARDCAGLSQRTRHRGLGPAMRQKLRADPLPVRWTFHYGDRSRVCFAANAVGDYDVTLRGATSAGYPGVTRTSFSVLPKENAAAVVAQKRWSIGSTLRRDKRRSKHHSTLHVSVRGPRDCRTACFCRATACVNMWCCTSVTEWPITSLRPMTRGWRE